LVAAVVEVEHLEMLVQSEVQVEVVHIHLVLVVREHQVKAIMEAQEVL
jgi:hypothetical protein